MNCKYYGTRFCEHPERKHDFCLIHRDDEAVLSDCKLREEKEKPTLL